MVVGLPEANVYFAHGRYDAALRCYKQALEVIQTTLGTGRCPKTPPTPLPIVAERGLDFNQRQIRPAFVCS